MLGGSCSPCCGQPCDCTFPSQITFSFSAAEVSGSIWTDPNTSGTSPCQLVHTPIFHSAFNTTYVFDIADIPDSSPWLTRSWTDGDVYYDISADRVGGRVLVIMTATQAQDTVAPRLNEAMDTRLGSVIVELRCFGEKRLRFVRTWRGVPYFAGGYTSPAATFTKSDLWRCDSRFATCECIDLKANFYSYTESNASILPAVAFNQTYPSHVTIGGVHCDLGPAKRITTDIVVDAICS